MLAARHAAERLQNCWHGGARSTGQLRDAMSAALAEYVTSGDSAEAARCLAELDVPHFHHELVKCAEWSSTKACNGICPAVLDEAWQAADGELC